MFITTKCASFNPAYTYVLKFVRQLLQVDVFLRFPPQINLTAMI